MRNCPIAHPLSVLPNHEDFPILHNVIRNFFSRYLPRVALPAEAPRAQCENLDRCYGKGNSLSFENWQQGHVKKTACPISKSIKIPVPVEFVDIVSRDLQVMGVPFPKCPNQGCEGRGHTKYDIWNEGHVLQKDCPRANRRVFLPDPDKFPDVFRELPEVSQIEMVRQPNDRRLGLNVPQNLEQERQLSVYRQFVQLTGTDSSARPSKRRRQDDDVEEISNFRQTACEEFPDLNENFRFCGCLAGKRLPKTAGELSDDVECNKCKSFWHFSCAGLSAAPRRVFVCPVCSGKWKEVYIKVFHN